MWNLFCNKHILMQSMQPYAAGALLVWSTTVHFLQFKGQPEDSDRSII